MINGVKKVGPTIKDLQEEFGGAGNFYIPIEEHYQLEDDAWKFAGALELARGMLEKIREEAKQELPTEDPTKAVPVAEAKAPPMDANGEAPRS